MRFKVLISILFLIIILNIFPSVIYSKEDNWHQFRFNSENNPVLENKDLRKIAPIISTEDEIRSTPVVVGNNVYIGNHNSGNLFAFNLETGEQLWKTQAPNWIHSEVIYVDNQLFVGY